MCIACVEYQKGNLTIEEFQNNIKEMINEEHDEKVLDDVCNKLVGPIITEDN